MSTARVATTETFEAPLDQAASGTPSAHGLIYLGAFDTPLGPMLGGATDDGVCLLEFTDRRALPREAADLERRFKQPFAPASAGGPAAEHLDSLGHELAAYFAGADCRFTVPLVTPGSAFERAVWAMLLRIPAGSTRAYGDLATDLGKPGASRAVGHANGRNRIAIVVPCHRVIETGGGLGGYGGGLDRKRWLLEHERRWAPSPGLFAASSR